MSTNSGRRAIAWKTIATAVWIVLLALAGWQFYQHRHFQEPVVLGPGVTQVKTLGEYFPQLKGTINDCNLYFLESDRPGGTFFVAGGSHPEEPAANLSALHLVENARVEQGRLIVAVRTNRSASTVTRPGEGYPQFYEIPTPWGVRRFRMGDRWSNPLDSWPDPEVYVHYPTRQMLANVDIRNLNRCWPGRPDGSFTEQTASAVLEVIRQEEVDVFIDLHEAELEYPVISTIVAHERGAPIAAMASMMLTSTEFRIGMEYSPKELRGLSHREVGDHSPAISLLLESPEPFLDRVRGITDERLLLTGQDAFVMRAGEHGLLYESIDENGWPIDVRVGRHNSTVLKIAEVWSSFNPGRAITISDLPTYSEVVAHGTGYYLKNPAEAPADRVVYD